MSKKAGFFLLLIVLLALGGYFLLRPRPQPPPAETGGTGIVLSGYDADGNLSWRIKAEAGEEIANEEGEFRQVVLFLYNAGKERLRAGAPTLSFAPDRARLTGGVEVSVEGKASLTADAIAWSKKEGTLSGTGEITLAAAKARVEARGFSYDPHTGSLSLTGGVSARIHEPSDITATGKEARYDSGKVVLKGGVVIKKGKETYHCAQAEYTEGNGMIELSGGVQGELPSGKLQAGRVNVRDAGITASSGVRLFLNLDFFGGENGA